MLYKLGGDFEYEGEFYTYTIVNDDEIMRALSEGWALTTSDAIKEAGKPTEYADGEKEPSKRRGRPPKAE
jgi:hypothetical protein